MKKFYLLVVLFASLHMQAQVNLTDSLYLYYKFDNNALDNSGGAHHGTIANATGTTDRCGNPNSALLFNGINSYVSIFPSLPDMSSFSLHAWVYYNDSTKNWGGIFSDADPTVYKDVFWSIKDSLIEVIYDKTQNGSVATAYPNKNLLSSWHQLVWVNTGTASRLYVDTVLVSTINLAGRNIGYHDTAYIGKMCDGSNSLRHFKGKLDEFRLYTRVLNTDEIAALYNLSCELSSIDNDEFALLQFGLYPNPAGSELNVSVPNDGPFELMIYDMQGKLLLQQENARNLYIGHLSPGNYLAGIRQKGATYFKRWVKQ